MRVLICDSVYCLEKFCIKRKMSKQRKKNCKVRGCQCALVTSRGERIPWQELHYWRVDHVEGEEDFTGLARTCACQGFGLQTQQLTGSSQKRSWGWA
jgi:hypothetical protein